MARSRILASDSGEWRISDILSPSKTVPIRGVTSDCLYLSKVPDGVKVSVWMEPIVECKRCTRK